MTLILQKDVITLNLRSSLDWRDLTVIDRNFRSMQNSAKTTFLHYTAKPSLLFFMNQSLDYERSIFQYKNRVSISLGAVGALTPTVFRESPFIPLKLSDPYPQIYQCYF